MRKITIDPVTRIEGHLKVEVTVDEGVVREAHCSGTLFRGLELILLGRHPFDAQRITQRICGVCPTSHSTASSLALDAACGVDRNIPENGRLLRNLILGANFLQSHILHFYHLAALDYVDVTAVADYDGDDPEMLSIKEFIARGQLGPFVPRYEGDYRLSKTDNQRLAGHYVTALAMRRRTHEVGAIFGGKMPHNMGVVPGGSTGEPTTSKIADFLWRLNTVRDFINSCYIPDVLAVASAYVDDLDQGKGCGNFLSYGAMDLDGKGGPCCERKRLIGSGILLDGKLQAVNVSGITESVAHSRYVDGTGGHPSESSTKPEPGKKTGYSWLKSPRYEGKVVEVGPLARFLVGYLAGDEKIKGLVDSALAQAGAKPEHLQSTLGRHLARALETKLVADAMAEMVLGLKPGEPHCAQATVQPEAEGIGMTAAPRGALAHWLKVVDGKIAHYQCVVPTTWNASPRDDDDQPGPIEQALTGARVRDAENPAEVVRIVRGFDPCLACAVHCIDARGRELGRYRVC